MQIPHSYMSLLVSSCFLARSTRAFISRTLPSIGFLENNLNVHCAHTTTSNVKFHPSQFQSLLKYSNNGRNFAHPYVSYASITTTHASSPNMEEGSTTSIEYALDPHSKQAKEITSSMGLTVTQHSQLVELAFLVDEWNDRINLISRKDCNPSVVFGRHILPSIALKSLVEESDASDTGESSTKRRVVDVGTGGGFPGLPLAILFPKYEFLLVDSVGKKIKVVQAMVEELGLANVKTHHGRAEEIKVKGNKNKYNVVLGRSVSSLPRFCFWIQDLVKHVNPEKDDEDEEGGKLVYIIGGEVEEIVTKRCLKEVSLNDLIPIEKEVGERGMTLWSDKRALVVAANEVKVIASESGEKKVIRGNNDSSSNKKNSKKKKKFEDAKGSWTKKDNSAPKERGYENFKRYSA